jgi:predicted phosphodiesterase
MRLLALAAILVNALGVQANAHPGHGLADDLLDRVEASRTRPILESRAGEAEDLTERAEAFAATFHHELPPPGLRIAFFGDSGLGSNARAVLQLVKNQGADLAFSLGDLDYANDPAAWEAQLDAILGTNFPVLWVCGNHDDSRWGGAGGYQSYLEARANRLGIHWAGSLGELASVEWNGVLFLLTAPHVLQDGDAVSAPFIRSAAAADANRHPWRFSTWHVLMRAMQAGGKGNESGWGVYEESRKAGAVIATAHEHSYSRTHLLLNMQTQTIAYAGSPLTLLDDDLSTPLDEGRSFAFVSGLGGQSIRNQEVSGAHFAKVYTSDQSATYGALFCTLNGPPRFNPYAGLCEFINVGGQIVDSFEIFSMTGQRCGLLGPELLLPVLLATRMRRRGRVRVP